MTRREMLVTAAAAAAASQAKGANDKITVGMIGAGARAQELMTAIQTHSNAEIVGVVDAYKGRVERTVDRTNSRAKPFKHYTDILADKSIDAVVVATPDHWHRKIILDSLAAGKDVYSEKPLTYKASEGVEIIEAARKHGRIVQVGSQGVSSEHQQKARDFVQSGKLGKVTMIKAAYNRNTASGAWIYPIPPDASPKTVDWEMFLGPAPKKPFSLERFFRWRCYEDYSGGIATDLFVHLCTTIHFIMGAKIPSAAIAMGQLYRWKESRDVPDTINAVLEYPEGFAVNLSSTFNNEQSAGSGFHFLGTEGSLALGFGGLTLQAENPQEDNRWIVESWPKQLEEEYFKNPQVIETELKKKPRREPEQVRGQGGDPTAAHFGHFFESIKTRKPYWEDASAGHHAAACAHMINTSSKRKRLVEWDFSKDTIKG